MSPAFRTAALVLMLSSLSATSNDHEPSAETGQSTNNFEAEFWDHIKAKDWTDVAEMLDPEIVAANRGAILRGKSAVLEHVKRIELSNFSYNDVSIRKDGNIVVIAFKMNAVATTVDGEPEPMNWRMISVWRRKGKIWLMISHAAIPVSASAIR